MRLAVPITTAVLAAALLAGCGGDSSTGDSTATPTAPAGAIAIGCQTHTADAEGLRATAVSCADARQLLFAWQRASGCASSPGASRSACTVGSYRCIGARTDRGLAVSCAKPGQSIAFVAKGD
jgi:hypothetical protein